MESNIQKDEKPNTNNGNMQKYDEDASKVDASDQNAPEKSNKDQPLQTDTIISNSE